ncbi:hypothetical protein [Tsukamurella strandjordii]|uniref:hypothetical protein n=1 Tax=Tsukamurella strandjordii TaxID=147577 RepID=UPI0031D82B3A
MTDWGRTLGHGLTSIAGMHRFSDADGVDNMDGNGGIAGRLNSSDGTELEEFDRAAWPDDSRLLVVFPNYQYGGLMLDLDRAEDVWDYSWESGLWVVERPVFDVIEDEMIRRIFGIYPPSPPVADEPHLPTDAQMQITAALACVFGRLAARERIPGGPIAVFDPAAFRRWASTLPGGLDAVLAPPAVITAQQISEAIAVIGESELDYSSAQTKRVAAIAGLGDVIGAAVDSIVLRVGVFRVIVSALTLPSAARELAAPSPSTETPSTTPMMVVRHPQLAGICTGDEIPNPPGGHLQRLVTFSGKGGTMLVTGGYGYAAWLDAEHVVTLFGMSVPSNQEDDGDRAFLTALHGAAIDAVQGRKAWPTV